MRLCLWNPFHKQALVTVSTSPDTPQSAIQQTSLIKNEENTVCSWAIPVSFSVLTAICLCSLGSRRRCCSLFLMFLNVKIHCPKLQDKSDTHISHGDMCVWSHEIGASYVETSGIRYVHYRPNAFVSTCIDIQWKYTQWDKDMHTKRHTCMQQGLSNLVFPVQYCAENTAESNRMSTVITVVLFLLLPQCYQAGRAVHLENTVKWKVSQHTFLCHLPKAPNGYFEHCLLFCFESALMHMSQTVWCHDKDERNVSLIFAPTWKWCHCSLLASVTGLAQNQITFTCSFTGGRQH